MPWGPYTKDVQDEGGGRCGILGKNRKHRRHGALRNLGISCKNLYEIIPATKKTEQVCKTSFEQNLCYGDIVVIALFSSKLSLLQLRQARAEKQIEEN